MSLVNHETGEVLDIPTAEEARRLTTEALNEFGSASAHHARGWELVGQAITTGAYISLDYRSPADYLHAEFDGVLSGLDVASRRLAARELETLGISTRVAAKVLGVSNKTVSKDRQVLPQVTPDAEDEVLAAEYDRARGYDRPREERSAEARALATSAPIIGRDGKTYTKPEVKPQRRSPLLDSFFRAVYEARKKVESLHRLTEDDRWPQNAGKAAEVYRGDLLRINDLLQQVIASLPETESTE